MKKIAMVVFVLVAAMAGCSMGAADWNQEHQGNDGTGGTAGDGGTGGSGTKYSYYPDRDHDGHGAMGSAAVPSNLATPPYGYASNADDCDDNNSAVWNTCGNICNPQQPYDCGNECVSGIGTKWCWASGTGYGKCQCENVPGEYCRDADGDTYGDPGNCTHSSTPPSGYVSNKGDCNDSNPNMNPGEYETCNGIDDNCDENIDEGGVCGTGGTGGAPTYYYYYPDNDHDGHGAQGSASVAFASSTPPYGYAYTADDCDDNDAARWNSCGSQTYYYYPDNDHDGHGAAGSSSIASSSSTPAYGQSVTNDDCDDNSNAVWNTCGTGGSGGSGPHPTDCSDLSGQKKLRLVVNARSGVTIQVRGAAVFWGVYAQDDAQEMAWCGHWQVPGYYNDTPVAQGMQHLDIEIPIAIESSGQDILINGIPQWMAWRGQVYLLDPGNTDIWHARYGFTANPVGAKAALQGDESCTLYLDGVAVTDNYCRPLGNGFHLVPNLTTGQNGQVDNPLNP